MLATEIGRNDPCPCGSARKYKKCCLASMEAARQGDAVFDPAVLVDACIDQDDWRPLDPYVDEFMALAAPRMPLEHLRFPGERLECTSGWLAWAEREVAYALTRPWVAEHDVDALRTGSYLLRRLGAASPIVEEIARVQDRELRTREKRVQGVILALAAGTPGLDLESEEWIRGADRRATAHARESEISILDFSEQTGLVVVRVLDAMSALWSDVLRARVLDRALAVFDDPQLPDRTRGRAGDLALQAWASDLVLAHAAIVGIRKPPLAMLPEEELAFESMERDTERDLQAELLAVVRRREDLGDFGAAALVRAAMRTWQLHARTIV